MDPAVLDAALERSPVNDDGRSGATLERVVLGDGTRVIVKRYDPTTDIVMQMVGDQRGREVDLWQAGFFDRLPAGVDHAILGGWFGADGLGVIVMRDLGDGVLTWHDTVDATRARTMFEGIASLHAGFTGSAPDGLLTIADVVGIFEPRRLTSYAGTPLVDYALRGWEHWPEVAPGEIGERVLSLALDSTPLVEALSLFPATVVHGDLATVNMALEPDRPGRLTLIDWGLAAIGPAELDLGRLIAGCAHLFDAGFDDLLDLHRLTSGPAYDERALRIGLLSGLVWLGWTKALDIAEHPDPDVRDRERVALRWWLHQAELAFETGVI